MVSLMKVLITKLLFHTRCSTKRDCCDIISKMQSRCQLENSFASGIAKHICVNAADEKKMLTVKALITCFKMLS